MRDEKPEIIREQIKSMLLRAPRPERIDTHQKVELFRKIAKQCQKTGGKSAEVLDRLHSELRAFYQ